MPYLETPTRHGLISRKACYVTENELDPCSTANFFFKKRVSELLIISHLHCQSIHYFALQNLPFRLGSRPLTDALCSRSHKIKHTGKIFEAILIYLQQILNTAPNVAKPYHLTGTICTVKEYTTLPRGIYHLDLNLNH